ncbi:MAG: hypothetical protein ACLFQV_11205 [Vulcanimicrobiota bacterium]
MSEDKKKKQEKREEEIKPEETPAEEITENKKETSEEKKETPSEEPSAEEKEEKREEPEKKKEQKDDKPAEEKTAESEKEPQEKEPQEKKSKKEKKKKKKEKKDKAEEPEKEKEPVPVKEEKKPEEPAPPAKDEAGNYTIWGILFAIALLVFVYYFNKKTAPPTPVEDMSTRAIQLVQQSYADEMHPIKTKLEAYRSDLEKQGVTIVTGNWEGIPMEKDGEKYKYYEVRHKWERDGVPIVFIWEVDLETQKVEAKSHEARELLEYEPEKAASPMPEISPTAEPSPSPEASPTMEPTETPEPSPSPVETPMPTATPSPSPTEGVLVPPTPIPTKVPGSPVPTKLPEPPEVPVYDEVSFELTGIMAINNQKQAIIKIGEKTDNVSVGEILPDNWRLVSIGQDSITVRKGDITKTLKLEREGTARPSPARTPDNTNDGDGSDTTPMVPAPEAGGGATPAQTPTRVPLD